MSDQPADEADRIEAGAIAIWELRHRRGGGTITWAEMKAAIDANQEDYQASAWGFEDTRAEAKACLAAAYPATAVGVPGQTDPTAALKIVEGGCYRSRDGGIHGPMIHEIVAHTFKSPLNGFWNEEGQHSHNDGESDHPLDLVERIYVSPLPPVVDVAGQS